MTDTEHADNGMRFNFLKPNPLLFVSYGKPVLTISPDLVLSLGEGVTVEEAAKGFVEIVNNNFQGRIRELESKLAEFRPSGEAVAAAKSVLEKHAKHIHLDTGELCTWAKLSQELLRLAGDGTK